MTPGALPIATLCLTCTKYYSLKGNRPHGLLETGFEKPHLQMAPFHALGSISRGEVLPGDLILCNSFIVVSRSSTEQTPLYGRHNQHSISHVIKQEQQSLPAVRAAGGPSPAVGSSGNCQECLPPGSPEGCPGGPGYNVQPEQSHQPLFYPNKSFNCTERNIHGEVGSHGFNLGNSTAQKNRWKILNRPKP